MTSTDRKITCSICDRSTDSPPPEFEDMLSPTVTEASGCVHERCKSRRDFLLKVSPSPEIFEARLKGYKAGKAFAAYMNPPYGLDTPSVSSYRVLAAVFWTMFLVHDDWRMGRILPGEHFILENGLPSYIYDVDPDEATKLQQYAKMAQVTLSYSVVLWFNAHKNRHKNTQDMYLDWDMYTDSWKTDARYFKARRHQAIAHIESKHWDSHNTHKAYEPYPDWVQDWNRFKKLVKHCIKLCEQDISQHLGQPVPDTLGYPRGGGGGFDPVQPGADFLTVFGTVPIFKHSADTSRLNDRNKYPLKHDGTGWIAM